MKILPVVPFFGQPDFGKTGGDQEFDDILSSRRERDGRCWRLLHRQRDNVAAHSRARTICMGAFLKRAVGRFAALDEVAVTDLPADTDPELASKAARARRTWPPGSPSCSRRT